MILQLTLTDGIILGIIAIILSLIIYFSFYKKKDDPCKGCPYAKKCNSKEECTTKKM
ncbi:MAG: FeoB-associated Cys-rich membrane protein [Bacilli bacterium]|nr:FeoB-associated Cys-rich membrane protein [Bacilli bacterium]